MSDDRLKKNNDPRVGDPRVTDKTQIMDREKVDVGRAEEMLARLTNFNTVLPSLPPIPGWHLCWVSTTNQNDTVEWRQNMGYEFVTQDEIKGSPLVDTRTGSVSDGRVMCKEMVAMKIREELYQLYMKRLHHDKPMEDESMLAQVEEMRDGRGRPIGIVSEFDGTREFLENNRPAPKKFA